MGQRIIIVGTTGSGKSTLARKLALRLNYTHIEVDGLYWQKNWTEIEPEAFRARVSQATSARRWVIDGDYSKVRDIVWAAADMVIWLDYSLPVIMWRLLRRTVQRIASHQELWGGNRETFAGAFLSRKSILLWGLKTYKLRRREYPLLLQDPAHRHLQVIRLRSPLQTERWLAGIE